MSTSTITDRRPTGYTDAIREDLAALGFVGRYDAHEIEAWMRCEHATLDGLDAEEFRREVDIARQCIDADPQGSRRLAESYGF